MDMVTFLTHRARLSGVPAGALALAADRHAAGGAWGRSLAGDARVLRRQAAAAEGGDGGAVVAATWLGAARSYQAASLEMHLRADPLAALHRMRRLRGLARACYRRALAREPRLARTVALQWPDGEITGYLRAPEAAPRLVVALVNGLDSICEVELHAFGDWFLARGFAVLALDLPACTGRSPRRPVLDVERAAPAVADWLAERFPGTRIAAFGVSFGGHLVARLLAGEPRFAAGVAVSPFASFDPALLSSPRMATMFRFVFDVEGRAARQFAEAARVDRLPAPQGRLLVLQMAHDALFGLEHATSFQHWGDERVEVWSIDGEHVGSSCAVHWLPDVCAWLEAAC